MRIRVQTICAFVMLLPGAIAADFRVGTSAVVINPPKGTPLAGYYSARASQDVLDDLFSKAAVIECDGEKAALVVCDLLSLPRRTILEARRIISERTGIPGDRVMIAATHHHTGPVVARESRRDDLDGGNSPMAVAYSDGLPTLIARAVEEANQRLVQAKVSAAKGREERLSFNRRYWMRDGTVGWNPGKLNPNVLRPAGPIDPEVGVLYFESADAKPLLTFVNFALHPDTTGGTNISADYPGVLARQLAGYKGGEMLTLFANGACGNLNHLNVHWAARQSSPAEARRIGTILAADILKCYMDLQPVQNGPLLAGRRLVPLPLAPVTADEITEAETIAKSLSTAKFMEQVKAFKVLDVASRRGAPLEVEIQVFALGKETAWVSLPGEVFVELGLSIKAGSPFQNTFLVELANGSIGYIPNKPAYSEGNYEVVSARCAAGSGELLVTAALELLKELHSGKQAK